ncbi:oligopeptide transporter 2 [[Candida] railenensis]|uniref:Oligopeptide transporter 2 n=1 Tax=[Candida] railenensis TaxID=45579 RepID=A0A9P0QQ64_9ASCO|nr:oligopeptide transporter 2 [[Candida] railenensis]
MPPSEKGLNQITSITSATSFREVEDHEVNLAAIASRVISIGEVGVTLTSEQKHFILKRLHYDVLESLDDLPVGATFMLEKIENLSAEEALEILKESYEEFEDDFNYPEEDLDLIKRLINHTPGSFEEHVKSKLDEQLDTKVVEKVSTESIGVNSNAEDSSLEANAADYLKIVDWDLQVRLEASILAYHSPYPEIRSVTLPYDDPSIPAETFRAYVIGVIWLAIGAFINQFFTERQPAITMSTAVAQLFLYPSGFIWYSIFPDVTVPLGKFSFRLNPGPWTYKEQMFATIIYAVADASQYVSYNIYSQKIFYGNTWATWGYQILLSLSTNFLGIGFAGILRRFSIYPTKSIWPTILPTLALNQALLNPSKKENINGWTISRYYFFFTVFGASFLWFWVPDYLFNALSYFNWMTWIKPMNFNLAMITGSYMGLGFNPITTFDWNIISFNYPLIYPWYSQINNYLGMLLAFPILCAIYWTNSKWSAYLPLNDNGLYNNVGTSYDVNSVLDSKGLLDVDKYEEYGPPFYTAGNLLVYGAFFAIYPFSVVYETAIRWKALKQSFFDIIATLKDFKKPVIDQFHDPHSRMMSRYPEVPEWCFLVILLISIVLAILCVELYPTETPVWAIFFAIGINFVFLIPLTMLLSSTGWGFGLNVLVELIIGYALPGNSQALMIIKAFGYNIDGQAQNYISDQKMAHYAKIPPRAVFRGQILAIFVGGFIGLAVMNWQFTSIVDICSETQSQDFTCPNSRTFFSASVLWGTIGPKRVFGGLYPLLRYCFLIGFLLVFPALALKWYGPKKWTRYFQPSIFIGGFLNYAPYNLSYYTPGVYASFAFMYYIKKHYLTWWEKYNFVLSGALDAGVAFSSIIIFFAVEYHAKSIDWWGNDVSWVGVDGGYGQQTILDAANAPDGYFGPRKGNFP